MMDDAQDTTPDYSSDAPLTSPDDDVFGRWPFSERIAHVIRDRKGTGSLVVGLYGSWGEGKTTVLNFVARALRDDDDVVVVRFNPWRFGDEEALIRSFFDSLAEGVDQKLRTKGDIARGVASKLLSVLSATLTGTVPGLSAAADSLDIDLSKLVPDVGNVDLAVLRERLSEILREASVRVVMVIDDIDRLDKQEVHAVFRLVKLSADFDGVTYLLAFDPAMVAASLQERYGSARSDAGRDFLDKIVTVPLQIPPARPAALLRLTIDIINDAIRLAGVGVEDDGAFVRAFNDGVIPALRTPRAARRYGNAILFALPILAGEVNAADQMLVEGMRVVYPGLYDHVRRHPEVYAAGHSSNRLDFSRGDEKKKARRALVDAAIAQHAPEHVAAATVLVDYLYPTARGGSARPVGYLRSGQRAASDWHFDRYFTYSLPEDAVSDRAFAEVVKAAETEGAEGVAGRLHALVTDENKGVVADMLYDVRETAPLEAVRSLVLGVAAVGDLFDEHDGSFMALSSENRATAALEDLVGRFDDPSVRQSLSEEIVGATPSVTFAMNYRGWADPAATGKGEGILTAEGGERLVEIVAQRVRDAAVAGEPPHVAHPESASRQYGFWMMGLGREGVEAYLADRFGAHPEEAWPLLRSQLPMSQSSARSGTYLGDYSRESYDALALYLDPAVLADAFAAAYDGRVLDAGFVDMDHVLMGVNDAKGLSPEEASVAQFMHVHRRATSEGQGEPGTDPAG